MAGMHYEMKLHMYVGVINTSHTTPVVICSHFYIVMIFISAWFFIELDKDHTVNLENERYCSMTMQFS